MGKIRVLLADDHQAVLDRVSGILGEDFDIVGAVTNGRDAVTETGRLDPDILVVDISMPILNGLQAADRLRAANRRTKVVFLTVHSDQDFVASSYITKSEVTTDLVPAIREALAGRTYISKSIEL